MLSRRSDPQTTTRVVSTGCLAAVRITQLFGRVLLENTRPKRYPRALQTTTDAQLKGAPSLELRRSGDAPAAGADLSPPVLCVCCESRDPKVSIGTDLCTGTGSIVMPPTRRELGHTHSRSRNPSRPLDKVADLDCDAKHLVSNSVFGICIQIKECSGNASESATPVAGESIRCSTASLRPFPSPLAISTSPSPDLYRPRWVVSQLLSDRGQCQQCVLVPGPWRRSHCSRAPG